MAKGDLTLHPKLGVNARMTTCLACGADTPELVMLGKHNHVTTCPSCGIKCYGVTTRGSCLRCKSSLKGGETRELADGEKVPGGLCSACEETRKQVEELVAAGGVHFRCKSCGSAGVIKAEHQIAIDTRDHYGFHNGEPCGVELPECPQCLKE